MPKTIEIIPDLPPRAMTTEEVAALIQRSERHTQKLGKDQIIASTLEKRPGGGVRRVFDPDSVRDYLLNPGQVKPKPTAAPRKPAAGMAAPDKPRNDGREPQKVQKAAQETRALDLVSVVGNQAIGYKGSIEALAIQSTRQVEILVAQMDRQNARFETFMGLMLNAQKAEADANRERLKAEREDARERWELERKDRLERLQSRRIPTPAPRNGKGGRA